MNRDFDIAITGRGSISPLGHTQELVEEHQLDAHSCISTLQTPHFSYLCAALNGDAESVLAQLQKEQPHYARVDRSVLLALYAARQAVEQAGWQQTAQVGVNIGSSRGATALFEQHHHAFSQHPEKIAESTVSPSTTLGNIASWVAQDIGAKGIAFSHSVTCSTALHAVANGVAWLQSGFAKRFLVGGAEAPLTAFTAAQMSALRIYSTDAHAPYPCRPFNLMANTMVLGEGAAVFCLEKGTMVQQPLAHIQGLGYAMEHIAHPVAISASGECLYNAMSMAIAHYPYPVDAIVAHAPGTKVGDAAELAAIRRLFGTRQPLVLSNKWKIGHTLGASGALGIEYALQLLQQQRYVQYPYPSAIALPMEAPISSVLVNAVGFGGNAVSILLTR